MPVQARLRGAEKFYQDALRSLIESDLPFLVGGAWAMRCYANITRDTKDLDIFCKASDYPLLLKRLAEDGYETELTDASWLAKARKGDHLIDLIFNSANRLCPVDDTWFEHARDFEILGQTVRLIPPEEQIWSKATVQDRFRFDGADVLHIIRHSGSTIDWNRLLRRMEPVWEVLLAHLTMFGFVYPSERECVPRWVMDDLLDRLRAQLDVPDSQDPICRGLLLSRTQYAIDLEEWGYVFR
jgi:hypothetical protein